LGSEQSMPADSVFKAGGHYQLIMTGNSTITIAFEETESDDDCYEIEMLEDYGRNLTPSELELTASEWKLKAYTVKICSYAGRAVSELRIMKDLAVSIAEALEGKTIIMSQEVLNISVGVYSPEKINESNLLD